MHVLNGSNLLCSNITSESKLLCQQLVMNLDKLRLFHYSIGKQNTFQFTVDPSHNEPTNSQCDSHYDATDKE